MHWSAAQLRPPLLTPPFSGMARQLGFRELIDMRKTDIEYAGSSIAGIVVYIKATRSWSRIFSKATSSRCIFFAPRKKRPSPAS